MDPGNIYVFLLHSCCCFSLFFHSRMFNYFLKHVALLVMAQRKWSNICFHILPDTRSSPKVKGKETWSEHYGNTQMDVKVEHKNKITTMTIMSKFRIPLKTVLIIRCIQKNQVAQKLEIRCLNKHGFRVNVIHKPFSQQLF